MGGWVKLYRCTLTKAIWNLNDAQRIVFFTILMLANHKEKQWIWKGKKFSVTPGQFITSIPSLAKSAKVSIKSVRTALVNLKKLDFLADETAGTGRLITVTNWALYQSGETETADETADHRQTIGRPSAANKNDKNVNTKEEDIYSEVIAYLNEKANTKYRVIEAHKKHIKARVSEGYSLPDFKTVIDKKVAEWAGTEQQKYLRPETLFGNKFDGYLNQQEGAKKSERTLSRSPGIAGIGGKQDSAGKIPGGFWA